MPPTKAHNKKRKKKLQKKGNQRKNNRIIAAGREARNKYKSEMQKHLNFN